MDFHASKAILRIPSSQLYLVAKHTQGPHLFSLLGGTKEEGESCWDTLQREFFEETSGVLKLIRKGENYYLQNGSQKWLLHEPQVIHEKVPYNVVFYIFDIYTQLSPDPFVFEINQQMHSAQQQLLNKLGYNLNVVSTMSTLLQMPLIDLLYKLDPLNSNWVYLEKEGIEFVPYTLLQSHLLEKNILNYL
jgi:8-oxo-dGTP pyrophosphatase MutT (NUDIX family)